VCRSTIFVLLLGFFAVSGKADQVTLKNGDRLTGTIVKSDAKLLVIKTEFAGDVNVQWDAVTGIASSQPLHLALKDGQTIVGTVTTTDGKFDVATRETGAVTASKDAVVAVRDDAEQKAYDDQIERLRHPHLTDFWSGLLDTGLSLTQGNSDSLTYALSGKAARVTDRDKITVYTAAIYAKSTVNNVSNATAHAIRGGVRGDLNVRDKVFVFGFTDFEYDQFQDLDLRIAVLSLFGGFLTPILVSEGKDAQVILFTYLLILGVGLLVIEIRRDWRSLAPLSFLLSQVYFWGWHSEFYRPDKLERTLVFATLFFLLYAALPVLRAIRDSALDTYDVLLVLANSFAYFGVLYFLLWPQDRWPLTLLALALSAGYVVLARLVPPPKSGEPPLARFLFAGLALTFATLAIPIRLDGKWITLAFSVEGAILVWTGFRSTTLYLRMAGYLLLALSAFRVLIFPLPAPQFLFNERFAAYAVLVACFGVVLYAAREYPSSVKEDELLLMGGIAVGINVFALIALSLELWDHFGHHAELGIDSGLAQHLSLSLLWTAYASGLIALGVNRQSALLRWQALVLFGLVVIKVFLYDSSYLERFYRIVSFFILGLVLLIVSFIYQRKVARERSPS